MFGGALGVFGGVLGFRVWGLGFGGALGVFGVPTAS